MIPITETTEADAIASLIDGTEEPINEYRDVAQKFMRVLNLSIDHVTSSKSPQVAAWAVAYVLESAVCEGVSMSDRAAALGVTPQALSKSAKQFQQSSGLPASSYMYQKGGKK